MGGAGREGAATGTDGRRSNRCPVASMSAVSTDRLRLRSIYSCLERIEPRGVRHSPGRRSDDTQRGAALRGFGHGRAEVMVTASRKDFAAIMSAIPVKRYSPFVSN